MIARHRRAEVIVRPIDLQIAAIAKTRGMPVVTRDRDFARFDVALVNPWEVA
jgi:predicted nucleic acid-binding protein